jgi:4'-phosphopantetheinyl transferase
MKAKDGMEENTAHIYLASLYLSDPQIKILFKLLSPEEKNRAKRYRFEQDRVLYIARHGILRILLGNYMKYEPDQIQFTTNTYGKPYLKHMDHNKQYYFNISYSNGMGVFAFAANQEIGVDIEFVKSIPEANSIVDNYFSPEEKNEFIKSSKIQRENLFYEYWTRKEALIKGIGMGLQYPIDRIALNLQNVQTTIVDNRHLNTVNERIWSIYKLNLPRGFKGALALRNQIDSIQYYDYSSSFMIKKGNFHEII